MRTYTTAELARRLKIGRATIYRWMRHRKIKGSKITRIGNGGVVFKLRLWTEKDVSDIKKYMQENYRKGRGRKPNPKT